MRYEELLEEAKNNDVYVIENANFKSKAEGLIKADVIGINRKVRTYRKRSCILAEELGHYHTTVGDILDQSSVENRKQEQRARVWAYNRLIGLNGLISAYKAGCRSAYEVANHLDVTEDFLQEAVACYRQKYGIYARIDNYVIYFEPNLAVMQVF